jgi:hypothetical protein
MAVSYAFRNALTVAAACAFVACGGSGSNAAVDGALTRDAVGDASSSDGQVTTGQFGHVVYLNFSGGTITRAGLNDAPQGRSWIDPQHQLDVVPPFMEDVALGQTYPTRDAVIAGITESVAKAFMAFDVQVVSRRPSLDQFTMVVIGGAMPDIGEPIGPLGIAATDACGQPTDLDLAFVATDAGARFHGLADPARAIAHDVVHEIGHTFGLVHDKDATGTYMVTGGNTDAWGAGPIDPVGGYTCGRTQQDDLAVLTSNVGVHVQRDAVPAAADAVPPSLTAVSLASGDVLTPTYQPCIQTADASGVAFAMMQVIAQLPTGDQVVQQQYLLAPPYRFEGLNEIAGAPLLLRIVAVDRYDNLSEQRVAFTFSSAGKASPPCT